MRENLRLIAAGLSLLIAVGCGENTTAPTVAANHKLSVAGAPSFDFGGTGFGFGDQSSTFIVTANGGSFNVGGLFSVNFPANSICADDGSYAVGKWDAACTPRKSALKITATVRMTSSGVAVDFSPDIRFVPSQTVTVSTDLFAGFIRANRSYYMAHPSALRPFAFYYSATLGGSRIADYVLDPSVVTHVDLNTGIVWRRVKHFSGYSMATGMPCDPAPGDPDCVEGDGIL